MSIRAEYEARGYADMAARRDFRLADCPYRDGWQRESWQIGAWRWMREQKEGK